MKVNLLDDGIGRYLGISLRVGEERERALPPRAPRPPNRARRTRSRSTCCPATRRRSRKPRVRLHRLPPPGIVTILHRVSGALLFVTHDLAAAAAVAEPVDRDDVVVMHGRRKQPQKT